MIFLDFQKAFDTSSSRLLLKAPPQGQILSGRTQCVVVNGSSSNWSPVLPGIPQGTVLGPICFFYICILSMIYIVPSVVSSKVKLLILQMTVAVCFTSADHDTVQQDLLQLEQAAKELYP